MVVSGRTLKRANAKQRRASPSDLRDFFAFPAGEDRLDGAFRNNIRQFLDRLAAPPPPSSILAPAALAGAQHLATMRVSFRLGPEAAPAADEVPEALRKGEGAGGGGDHEPVVDLDVVEEDVARARTVYCDHCRVVGWSGHPVCGKRYHFIIRNGSNPAARTHQLCAKCCTQLDSYDTRCPSCKYEVTIDDLEEWANFQLEDPTHLLHGVIHANGYGHLLRVNGLEGGSKILTGFDIMDFWDRICKMLRVRKVTVMDISKKYGLEYRLLHAVAMGRTWYGDWGYEFGAGSFGVTAEAYRNAVETLSGLHLSFYFSHLKVERNKLHDIIAFYWSLTDRQLLTIGDLFRFLIEQSRKGHKQGKPHEQQRKQRQQRDEAPSAVGVLCAWSNEDVVLLEEAMIKVLRAVCPGRWVSKQALRGSTFKVAGSPELLDFCLKGLAGRITSDGSMIVATRCNPESNAIEYRLEDASNSRQGIALAFGSCNPSEEQIVRDLKFLYEALLNPQTMHEYQPVSTREIAVSAATRILDCKKFVKDYEKSLLNECKEKSVLVWCCLELLDQPKDYTHPPPELLVLPAGTSIPDFRSAIQKAYQETYLVFRKFELDHVLELKGLKEKEETNVDVRLLFRNSGHVTVRGRCSGMQNVGQYRKERGLENWTVDCVCGATDDDGERMVACDDCGVWRHTRCLDIKDTSDSPKKFICGNCNQIASPAGPRSSATLPRPALGKRTRDVAPAGTWGPRLHINGGHSDDDESRTGIGKKSRKWGGSDGIVGDNNTISSAYMGISSGKQGKYMINMPILSEEEECSDGSVLTEEGISRYRDHPQSPPTPSGGGVDVSGRCITDAVNLDLPTPMTINRIGRFITSVGG